MAFYRIAAFDSLTDANNSVNVSGLVNANPNNPGLEPGAVINMGEVGGSNIDLSSFFSCVSNVASNTGSDPAVPSWIAILQGMAATRSPSARPTPTWSTTCRTW